MKLAFWDSFSRKIGIDLGTSRVRIWSDKEGFAVDEPTCIAIETPTQKVIAVGQEALEMQGRVANSIEVIFPLQAGVISDTAVIAALLKVLLQKVLPSSLFFRPIFMVSVSSYMGEVEKKALTDALFSLGAHEVNFIHQVVASAIGAGIPIADASGSFLLQVGAGVVEGGIISLGSLIAVESSDQGGQAIDQSVQRILRQEYLINVSARTAEKLKQKLVKLGGHTGEELHVTGQDVVSSIPKEVIVTDKPFVTPLQTYVEKYIQLVKRLFEQVPAELTTDVIDKGMLLAGGGALLRGLDQQLLVALGVPVSVVEDPDKTVIRGLAQVLENLELFKESVGYQE